MTDLPGILAEIAHVAGEDAALAVARVRGGTQVYIPPVPDADHWMSQLIGDDRAKAVCDRLTCGTGIGMRIDLPFGPSGLLGQARAMADAMIRDGRSEQDIVAATGYTGRTIRARRAAQREKTERDKQQLKLF